MVDEFQPFATPIDEFPGDAASMQLVDGADPTKKATVTSDGELRVIVTGGGTAGQLVQDGALWQSGDVGRVSVGFDGTNYQFVKTDSDGHLQIDVLTLPNITIGSALPAGDNNIGNVDVVTMPSVTLASQANPFTSAIPVSGTFWPTVQPVDDNGGSLTVDGSVSVGNFPSTYDVSDRAGRLLGVVYGSQGQQLKQTATNYNLASEIYVGASAIDPRQIRALTASDVVTANQGGTWTVQQGTPPWQVQSNSLNLATEATLLLAQTSLAVMDDWDESDRAKVNPVVGQAGLAAGTGVDTANALRVSLATDIPLPAGTNRIGGVRLVDRNDYALDAAPNASIPTHWSGVTFLGQSDDELLLLAPTIIVDSADGFHRLAVTGKVSTSPPEPPPDTTPVTIDASNPLDVSTSHTTDTLIANGVTFHILQIVVGAEGDPNEKGSKVEIFYVDSSAVEHLIDRLYVSGFTEFGDYPDTSQARDGTSLVGNGTSTYVRIVRTRLGGAALEIDAVVRGYTV